MTKTATEILQKVRECLFSSEFKDLCRTSEKHFTRRRVFSCPIIIVFIANLVTGLWTK
ncbi:hypothetical protein SCG7086_BJ_00040 [Chlamydiales bacterium SCGC AG-110-P3]|nr:hypothetical protein SCG7086_BJ_00040 [Chlamydiales bacterium SCGC AG-110-P3]